ncbi:hypothetical protein P389DRAFT_198752 [Cystobasidium minutum MCA 4210]|uniref:uncharacterized protein n=1 Tax=Cystobasidium minutum MCA 4210 TaxID=1397322 RepID=UPI0034CDDA55|eukprot:jgi/Rhomi1/198752/gm1.6966_g
MAMQNPHEEALQQLPSELNDIIARLAAAKASEAHLTLPRKSQAGVLVLLCPSRTSGEVHVLLTTRAMTMRSFPGETALPGGKMEESDVDIASTALREALEETALDAAKNDIKVINTLQPYLSKNLLFVIPTVAYTATFAEDLLLQLKPNAAEVGAIWTWPLKDMLGLATDESVDGLEAKEVTNGDQHYENDNQRKVRYSYRDVKWLSGASFRLHEFQHEDMGSAITGLTAEILLEVALIAYNKKAPYFERAAPGQLSAMEMVKAVLDGRAGLDGDERSSLRKGRVTEDTVAAVGAPIT